MSRQSLRDKQPQPMQPVKRSRRPSYFCFNDEQDKSSKPYSAIRCWNGTRVRLRRLLGDLVGGLLSVVLDMTA